jgi:ISXO2-like transposase domain
MLCGFAAKRTANRYLVVTGAVNFARWRDRDGGDHVVGSVHPNAIEDFWSILKRGVAGSYHKVSREYLPLYVAEFQLRYNNRENVDIFGATTAGC